LGLAEGVLLHDAFEKPSRRHGAFVFVRTRETSFLFFSGLMDWLLWWLKILVALPAFFILLNLPIGCNGKIPTIPTILSEGGGEKTLLETLLFYFFVTEQTVALAWRLFRIRTIPYTFLLDIF
jgi:hypothetical protein